MENDRYIYGVGLVVVKGAFVEHLLHELVPIVMADASGEQTKKVLKGGYDDVADKLKKVALTYLAGDQNLIDRLNRVLDEGSKWMRQRNELAHSTWMLDPDAPPGFDHRWHIRSKTGWYVGGAAFETIASKLGLTSVKLIELTNDVRKRSGNAQPPPP